MPDVAGSDEVWHHYMGDPVDIHMILQDGEYCVKRLGSNIGKGEQPQIVVPSHVWQAACPVGEEYALCGCTVAPGFDFSDFNMPSREALQRLYPHCADVIERLTRPS